jgi:peptidoglycan/LPS O-acetylase OafA/YrhL
MGLRLGRVYPLHLLSIAILAMIEMLSKLYASGQADGRFEFTGPFSLTDLWQNIFLLQSFGLRDHLGWNIVSWSIAAEVWAYLFFALAMAWIKKGQAAFFTATALLALCWLWWRSDNFLEVTHDLGFVRCLYGFALGVLVKQLWQRWPRKASTLVEALIVTTVFGFVSWASTGNLTYLAPPLFALVVFAFASENGRLSQCLLTAPFRLAGKLSYAIYMFHLIALARYFDLVEELQEKLGTPLPHDLLTIGALLFVMLVAWPAWHFVEVPFREWSRRKILRFPAK